ncbi:MAG: hypothetical protein ACOVKS_13140, partial [Aquimonas sp.]
ERRSTFSTNVSAMRESLPLRSPPEEASERSSVTDPNAPRCNALYVDIPVPCLQGFVASVERLA